MKCSPTRSRPAHSSSKAQTDGPATPGRKAPHAISSSRDFAAAPQDVRRARDHRPRVVRPLFVRAPVRGDRTVPAIKASRLTRSFQARRPIHCPHGRAFSAPPAAPFSERTWARRPPPRQASSRSSTVFAVGRRGGYHAWTTAIACVAGDAGHTTTTARCGRGNGRANRRGATCTREAARTTSCARDV